MTKSHLAAREAAAATGLPAFGLQELQTPEIIGPVLGIPAEQIQAPAPEPAVAWPVDIPGLVEEDPQPLTHDDADDEDFVNSRDLQLEDAS
ncbi:hypothetical protein ACQP1U_03955 [Actinomycetota bacterium]